MAEILAKWNEYNEKLYKDDGKPKQKAQQKVQRKGVWKGKEDLKTQRINIEVLDKGSKLCLGTFLTAQETALAYDYAARVMYGPSD